MRSIRYRALLALVIAPLQACGGAAPPASAAVYVSLGSRQCEQAAQSVADIQRRAQEAGLTVLSTACGLDGAMYAAVCGGPDGRIVILEIPSTQLPLARAIGLRPLDDLPDARRVPCG